MQAAGDTICDGKANIQSAIHTTRRWSSVLHTQDSYSPYTAYFRDTQPHQLTHPRQIAKLTKLLNSLTSAGQYSSSQWPEGHQSGLQATTVAYIGLQ